MIFNTTTLVSLFYFIGAGNIQHRSSSQDAVSPPPRGREQSQSREPVTHVGRGGVGNYHTQIGGQEYGEFLLSVMFATYPASVGCRRWRRWRTMMMEKEGWVRRFRPMTSFLCALTLITDFIRIPAFILSSRNFSRTGCIRTTSHRTPRRRSSYLRMYSFYITIFWS